MKGGLGNILKQAQAMQENLKRAQQELAALEISGSSGGGMVRVTMTGRHEVKRVEIDAELLKDDKEVLEDLVTVAVNDAASKVEQATQEKMSRVTGGLGLPPGMPMPF